MFFLILLPLAFHLCCNNIVNSVLASQAGCHHECNSGHHNKIDFFRKAKEQGRLTNYSYCDLLYIIISSHFGNISFEIIFILRFWIYWLVGCESSEKKKLWVFSLIHWHSGCLNSERSFDNEYLKSVEKTLPT